MSFDVKVNGHSLTFPLQIPDIGGAPDQIDCTCLGERLERNVPGLLEVANFEATYLFEDSDASDYRRLKALEKDGAINSVDVTLPDGTQFRAIGYIKTYVEGAKVDKLITAKLVVSLQSEWEKVPAEPDRDPLPAICGFCKHYDGANCTNCEPPLEVDADADPCGDYEEVGSDG